MYQVFSFYSKVVFRLNFMQRVSISIGSIVFLACSIFRSFPFVCEVKFVVHDGFRKRRSSTCRMKERELCWKPWTHWKLPSPIRTSNR